MEDYLPVLIQIIIALCIGSGIVIASHIFGQRAKTNAIKDSAYECGIAPIGTPHPRFGAKFYVVAMLFVVFDLEIVFLLPFVLAYGDFVSNNIPVLLPVLFFIALVLVGIVYEVKKGALDWGIPKNRL